MERREGKRGAPGEIEYLFGLPFPSTGAMRNAPVLAVLPDDKLYVADLEPGSTGFTVFVARVGRDGKVDQGFGRDGWVAEYVELGFGKLAGLLPREDGGVIAMVTYGVNNRLDVALVCFKPNGGLDPTFGEGGTIIHSIPLPEVAGDGKNAPAMHEDSCMADAAGQASGTDIVAADDGGFYCLIGFRGGPFYALIRCRPDGRLDTSFNGTGYVADGEWFYAAWSATDMVVMPDGGVTLVGIFYNVNSPPRRLAFWRFHPDGSLDRSFGQEGYAFFDADSVDIGDNYVRQMELLYAERLPDGGIAACGLLTTRSEANVFQTFGLLACVDPSGKVPDTFNGGKFRLFGVLGNYQTDFAIGGLGVQSDGKIVAGGGVDNSSLTDRELLVVRFHPTGTVDSTFGNGGMVRFSPKDFRMNFMSNLIVDSRGKILGAGGGGPDDNVSSMIPFAFQLSG